MCGDRGRRERERTDGSPISELETRQRGGEGGKKRGKGDVKCDIKSGSLPRLSAACLGTEEGGVGDGRGRRASDRIGIAAARRCGDLHRKGDTGCRV